MSAPLLVDLLTAPGHLLRLAQQTHTEAWARLVQTVTGPQYAVLVVVDGWRNVDQKRVGHLASLDRSTLADIVTRLAARGWLERNVDAADQRRRLISLTEYGTAQLPQLTEAARKVQSTLLAPLAADERAHFVDLLARVARLESSDIATQQRSAHTLQMSRTPGYLLRRAQQVHASCWARAVPNVTGPQYAVLASVSKRNRATQAEIGALAGLDSSSVMDVVERLGRKGWVVKMPDARDRRAQLVHLTEPAEIALRLLHDHVVAVQEQLLAPLSARDAADLLALMRQINMIQPFDWASSTSTTPSSRPAVAPSAVRAATTPA